MKKKVYALGFFDGVHLGHQALLNTCKEMAAQLGGIPCALTFDTYPRSLVTGEQTRLLNSVADRIMLLKQLLLKLTLKVIPYFHLLLII